MARGDDTAIELVVRDLRSGEAFHHAFSSEEEACDWLRDRPPFMEMLGVTRELPHGTSARMHRAMRPMDDDEQRAAVALEEQRSELKEAERQIQLAVARGFMLERRGGPPRRG